MMLDTTEHTCALLEETFREIETTRMEGIPILNNALSVAAFGFETYQEYRLGVLLTPWFMNLMLLSDDPKEPPEVGAKITVGLPAGQVEFIVGYEDKLGYYLSCSLYSPVFEFDDQDAAVQTAQAALKEIMNANIEINDDDADMADIWAGRVVEPEIAETETVTVNHPPKDVSRRDFLRGAPSPTPDDVVMLAED